MGARHRPPWLELLVAGALGCQDVAATDPLAVHVAALRPDAPESGEQPPSFAAGERVERFDSDGGDFRVHFTRSGEHRVPPADLDADAIPDHVQLVAREYDAIARFYRDTLGLQPPLADDLVEPNGGDPRFDVYLLDFPTSADGAFRLEACSPERATLCTGYMVLENDFDRRGYPSREHAVRTVASHELFHAIQAAYRARSSVVLEEATAVWASESYDPELTDFEKLIDGYLNTPERSLGQEPSGPVDDFSYGSALLFRYLEERHGGDLVRELFEALAQDASLALDWLEHLDLALQRRDSGLGLAFEEFARWNLYTGTRADPALAYAQGDSYPEVRQTVVALPFVDERVRVFPLSARYYRSATPLTADAGISLAAADGSMLQGVRILLALERSGRLENVQVAHASDGPLVLERTDGAVLHAAVINTRTSGESARPALCVGDMAALRDCMPPGHAPPSSNAAQAPMGQSSGCSIASARTAHDGTGTSVPLIALALAVAGRREWRRRRQDVEKR